MILHSVTLRNFRQHADTSVRLRRGLTGIIGPNGGGKSTILEAVAWAFYGADAVRATMKTVRWHGAPERHKASVEVAFELAGSGYTLTRTENSATLSNEAGAVVAATPRVVAEHVAAMLGLSHEEFCLSYLTPQKALSAFLDKGGEERRSIIRKVMGVGRLDVGVKAAGRSARDLAARVDGQRAGLGERASLEVELTDARSAVDRSVERQDLALRLAGDRDREHTAAAALVGEFAGRKAEHERLVREKEAADRDDAATVKEIERLTAEITEAEQSARRVEEKAAELEALPALRAERDALIAARAAVQRRADLAADAALTRDVIADAEAQIAAYDAAAHQQTVAEHEAVAGEHERLRAQRIDEARRLGAEYTRLGARAEHLEARHATLAGATDAACPTCAQPLGERLRVVLDEIAAEAEDARSAAESARRDRAALMQEPAAEAELAARAESLRSALKVLDGRRADAEHGRSRLVRERARLQQMDQQLEALGATEFNERTLAIVSGRIEKLEELDRALAEARVRAARKPELLKARSAALRANGEAGNRSGHAMIALHRLAFDPGAHTQAEAAAERARQALETARTALARAEAEADAAELRVQRAEGALGQYDARAEQLAVLVEELRIEEQAAERLAGLRTAFVQTIRPELEELVSGFVATLTDGRYEAAAIGEDFGVTLYRGGIQVDVASGGEEDVVAIALRLATSLMIAERAGHSLSCIILDEPFGSLDAVRRRNVLNLLTQRLRGLFEQVIVISHFEDVEQAVEHPLVVEYDEARGVSRVRALDLVEEVLHAA